jgi:Protein of unknown function (DUF3135)
MNYENNDGKFPFDEWAKLAHHDPLAFESARRQVLQSLIESMPLTQRRRLEGLQWQIDRERELASNPLASCLKISSLMWDKVLGANGLVDNLEQLSGAKPPREQAGPVAAVLPFTRRADPG